MRYTVAAALAAATVEYHRAVTPPEGYAAKALESGHVR